MNLHQLDLNTLKQNGCLGKQTLNCCALVLGLTFGLTTLACAQEVYRTDPTHTEVRFGWNHSGMSNQTGEFHRVDGVLKLNREDLAASHVSVTIGIDSIATGVPALDDGLKEAGFFDAANFPEASFESTQISVTGEQTADITGNLTFRDVTLPITLNTI